ncbi:MAG: DUF3301 domain-containing protein [Thioalkalispiraceae bacterium]|jgi:hypothetical protein
MEWILFPFLALLLWLWWGGLAAKEVAHMECKRLCSNADVLFLDDSVALIRLRLCRHRTGRIGLYRRFAFEFSTDGELRYKGYVDMLGETVIHTHMDPYRI